MQRYVFFIIPHDVEENYSKILTCLCGFMPYVALCAGNKSSPSVTDGENLTLCGRKYAARRGGVPSIRSRGLRPQCAGQRACRRVRRSW